MWKTCVICTHVIQSENVGSPCVDATTKRGDDN